MEKRSPVWKYFVVCEDDDSKAFCTICEAVISRGKNGSKKHFTTSPLHNHLSFKHPDAFKVVTSLRTSIPSNRCVAEAKFPSSAFSERANKKKKEWDLDCAEAYKIHTAIGKMMAVDIHSYSLVEDIGFKSLLSLIEPRYSMPNKHYFSEKIIPEMYATVKSEVQSLIDEVKFLSFSIDRWTANSVSDAIVITAHWINDTFERKSAVLHCQQISDQHVELQIVALFIDLLQEWNIDSQKVHVILCDTCDLVKAMHEVNLSNVICFKQTLQLVIHDAILSHPSVSEILAAAHRIVKHFEQSSVAAFRLQEIQQEVELPTVKFCDDVTDCWNTTFCMLQQLLDQKRAIMLYGMEVCDPGCELFNLTASQWNLISGVVAFLKPFDQLLHEISSPNACLSMILPAIQAVLMYLQEAICGNDSSNMMDEILRTVKYRFLDLFENELLTISAGLDPRFKLNFLPEEQKIKAKVKITKSAYLQQSQDVSIDKQPLDDDSKPLAKKAKITHDDFWTSWDLLQTSTCQVADGRSTDLEKQLNAFLTEPCIARDLDPVSWWQSNAERFPALRCCAQYFLAAPASSTPSESLFVISDGTLSGQRYRALEDNFETLVFLKANVSCMNI